jgi:hypothetical protein
MRNEGHHKIVIRNLPQQAFRNLPFLNISEFLQFLKFTSLSKWNIGLIE